MSCKLTDQHCSACRGDVPCLEKEKAENLLKSLHTDWHIVDNHHLIRSFVFPDFKTALDFTNQIAEIAEQEAHHPDIYLAWGKVEVKIWTHKVNGLTENDFILAAKYDSIPI